MQTSRVRGTFTGTAVCFAPHPRLTFEHLSCWGPDLEFPAVTEGLSCFYCGGHNYDRRGRCDNCGAPQAERP